MTERSQRPRSPRSCHSAGRGERCSCLAERRETLEQEDLDAAIAMALEYVRCRASSYPPGTDLENLEAAAIEAAWVALRSYDVTKGTQINTWVNRNVAWAVQEARRDNGKARSPIHRALNWESVRFGQFGNPGPTGGHPQPVLERTGGRGVAGYITVEEIVGGEQFTEAADTRIMLQDALSRLPKEYRYLVEQHDLHERPLQAIAKDLGINRNTATARYHKAILLLREMLQDC